MDKPITNLRRDYQLSELREDQVDADPVRQFDRWFDDAIRANLIEPNAMTLATVDAQGRPAARVVLLKGYDAAGFLFYTSYESRKGREIAANPHVALCFWWDELERQVRVEGRAEPVAPDLSDDYFATRPRASQLGATASAQSEPVPDRAFLEDALDAARLKYDGQSVPRPPTWGGYRVRPDAIEFWQGQPARLHDRLRYERDGDEWRLMRLAP